MKKLLLSLAVVAGCSLAANADYYLIGGFNGWTKADPNCLFSDKGNGIWELDYIGTLSSGFKINDGTWEHDDANFGGTATLVVGQTYALEVGGSSGNIPLSENIENPHIVFNPAEATLLITGEEVEAFYIYGIHGSIFTGDWMTVNMTEDTDNGVWFMEKTDFIVGEFGIKQMDADSEAQTAWICAASDNEVVIGAVMNCAVDGAGGNFKLNTPGSYSVVYDPKAMTIVFSEEDYNGVKALNTDNGEEVIYNLQGVRVNKANAAPGIYIVNGKKTVLR